MAEPSRGRVLATWVPALAWAGLIFLLSSQPSPAVQPPSIPHGDKLAHAGAYAILAWLAARALLAGGTAPARALLLAVLLGSLYGASDELHQSFVPGRDADPLDWAADAAGALLGAAAAVGLPGRRARASIRR